MNPLWVGLIVASFVAALSAIGYLLIKLQAMQQDITVLKTQVSPLWAQVQSRIASDLHQPHPRYIEMDELLEKLEALTITDGERIRLASLLTERSMDMSPDITEIQRKEARLMIQIMHIVVLESKGLGAIILGWFAVHLWR